MGKVASLYNNTLEYVGIRIVMEKRTSPIQSSFYSRVSSFFPKKNALFRVLNFF